VEGEEYQACRGRAGPLQGATDVVMGVAQRCGQGISEGIAALDHQVIVAQGLRLSARRGPRAAQRRQQQAQRAAPHGYCKTRRAPIQRDSQ